MSDPDRQTMPNLCVVCARSYNGSHVWSTALGARLMSQGMPVPGPWPAPDGCS